MFISQSKGMDSLSPVCRDETEAAHEEFLIPFQTSTSNLRDTHIANEGTDALITRKRRYAFTDAERIDGDDKCHW